MLGREHNCFQPPWIAFLVIFHRNLCFPVWAQVRQGAVLADFRKLQRQPVRQGNRVWHQFWRFIGGIAEHHALIPCADSFQFFLRHFVFLSFQGFVHAHCNICGLLIQRYHHGAGIPVKPCSSIVVANFIYGIPYNLLDIDVSFGGDFPCHQHKPGAGRCFTGYPAHRVLCHQCV